MSAFSGAQSEQSVKTRTNQVENVKCREDAVSTLHLFSHTIKLQEKNLLFFCFLITVCSAYSCFINVFSDSLSLCLFHILSHTYADTHHLLCHLNKLCHIHKKCLGVDWALLEFPGWLRSSLKLVLRLKLQHMNILYYRTGALNCNNSKICFSIFMTCSWNWKHMLPKTLTTDDTYLLWG